MLGNQDGASIWELTVSKLVQSGGWPSSMLNHQTVSIVCSVLSPCSTPRPVSCPLGGMGPLLQPGPGPLSYLGLCTGWFGSSFCDQHKAGDTR